MTLSLSYSFCVQCSQNSKLLTFRENLDLNYFFLWSPCWSSCSFSVLYFILLYPTLLVSLDCPFSSLPLSVFSNVLFIFHCAWSKITLPPRKKTDVTSVNFSVISIITTLRCENIYPMLCVSLDCLFSTLLFSVCSNMYFIFNISCSKLTLPPRKKSDVTCVNFSVMSVITTHRCENIYPMLFVSLDCPFSSLPLSIFSNVWLYIPYCVF